MRGTSIKRCPLLGCSQPEMEHEVKHDLKCFCWSISLLMVLHPPFYVILNLSWSLYFIKGKNKICDTRRSFVCLFFASHKMFKNQWPMSKCLVMVDMKTKEENEKRSRKHEKLTGPSYRREKRQELMTCCSAI